MNGLFDGVIPFVHTARNLSFRKAAAELGVTPAAVSKSVQRLEAELGVLLLNRTTRRVALSEAGALFLARCEEAMAQVQAGRDLLAGARRVPRGPLHVSLPFVLGRQLMPPLQRFVAHHPGLHLHLHFTDRKVRLVDEHIDVAVRVGPLADSALLSRRVGATRWTTVAAPAYLARKGTPQTPEDLAAHDCVRFLNTRGKVVPWTFVARETVSVPGKLDLDEGALIVDAALAGIGIAQVFDHMAREHVAQGRLVEVLAEHATAGPHIFAVCLPARRRAPEIRAFIDFTARALDGSA